MSIHPEILDLIQAEIDGVATEAEQVRLRDAIAADPAVRDEYRRLRGLCDILAGIPPAEPPSRLAPSVMRAVRAKRHDNRGGLAGWFGTAWPGGRVVLGYGYAVAAGAVIGALGLYLASGGSLLGPAIHEGDAGATIAPAHATGRLNLQPAGIEGYASLTTTGSGASIGLDLTSAEPVELVVRYDPAKGGDRVRVAVVRDGVATEAGSIRASKRR